LNLLKRKTWTTRTTCQTDSTETSPRRNPSGETPLYIEEYTLVVNLAKVSWKKVFSSNWFFS